MIKPVLNALVTQLAARMTYANHSGYFIDDPVEMIRKNKFPSFSVFCNGVRHERVAELPRTNPGNSMVRNVYTIEIKLFQGSINKNVAFMGDDSKNIKGVYDMISDCWDAITYDATLRNGVTTKDTPKVVEGILPEFDVITDYEPMDEPDQFLIAGAVMAVEFFQDIEV